MLALLACRQKKEKAEKQELSSGIECARNSPIRYARWHEQGMDEIHQHESHSFPSNGGPSTVAQGDWPEMALHTDVKLAIM